MRITKLILLMIVGMNAKAQDMPNYDWEERLQSTYKGLENQNTSKEEWDVMTIERNVDSYQISAGDNLWDVSKTIFGSGFFWPKLWQLNGGITNPHDISPGQSLNFIDMGLEAPPVLKTSGGSIEIDIAEQKNLNVEDIEKEDLELSEDELLELNWQEPELPPGKITRKALGNIPPSFFDWQSSRKGDEDNMRPEADAAAILKSKRYFLEYYIADNLIQGDGVVVETELGYTLTAATYEYVFTQIKAAGVGDEFVAVKNLKPVYDANTKDLVGFPVEVQAKLKIVETVDEKRNLHKAIIVKSFQPVAVGSKLIAGDLVKSTWGIRGKYVDVKANIMGGRFSPIRHVLGLGSVVYLDKGKADGLTEGVLLNILKNNNLRGVKLENSDAPSIGRLKVIHVSDKIATGLVVESKSEIRVGDFTGNPVSLQISQ